MKAVAGMFGFLFIFLGAGGSFFALREGQITYLSAKGYRPESTREGSPLRFWSAVGAYMLLILSGVAMLLAAALGM